MTQTFKVGDKVVNDVFGPGEIVYGPYGDAGRSYFMKAEDGIHHTVSAEFLKPAAKFKVGDKVQSFGDVYTILAGPFHGYSEWYVVEDEDGKALSGQADDMTAVDPADETVKVGDVVRILEDGACHADVSAGDLFEVKRVFSDGWDGETRIKVDVGSGARMDQWTFRPQDFEKVAADKVATYEGVVYDLSARYCDRDGDYWSFERRSSGDVVGNCTRFLTTTPIIGDHSDPLSYAVEEYGPLTRV